MRNPSAVELARRLKVSHFIRRHLWGQSVNGTASPIGRLRARTTNSYQNSCCNLTTVLVSYYKVVTTSDLESLSVVVLISVLTM